MYNYQQIIKKKQYSSNIKYTIVIANNNNKLREFIKH